MTDRIVKYSELCDGNNILDQRFKEYVRGWMERLMPSGPMGLLSTDYERWEVQADRVHTTQKVTWSVATCSSCGEEYEQGQEDEECCYDDEDQAFPLQWGKHVGWVVINENTGEEINEHTDYAWQDVDPWRDEEITLGDQNGVYVWYDDEEAEEAAKWCDEALDQERSHELRYGFPWANGTWFMPENSIPDEELKQAGFVVATYVGGGGDWRTDEIFRLCGIDGGGYSFEGQHFAKLVALHTSSRQWTVPTDQGEVLIDMDERPDLVKLAGVKEEVE